MAQHRMTRMTDRRRQLSDCDVPGVAVTPRGRHRARARATERRGSVAVGIAVAAGALVTAGAQYASPAQAQAVPVHEATPMQDPVAEYLPQILAIPEISNINDAIEQLAKGQRRAEVSAARDAAALRPLFVRSPGP